MKQLFNEFFMGQRLVKGYKYKGVLLEVVVPLFSYLRRDSRISKDRKMKRIQATVGRQGLHFFVRPHIPQVGPVLLTPALVTKSCCSSKTSKRLML